MTSSQTKGVTIYLVFLLLFLHCEGLLTLHSNTSIKLPIEKREEVLKTLFLNYNKNVSPSEIRNENGTLQAVKVFVNLQVVSLGSINIINMEYTTDLLLRLRWTDFRLKSNETFDKLQISFMRDQLWLPDLFFRNLKEGVSHVLTKPNYFLWLYQNGDILYSQKISLRLSCPMDLWLFPMDTQNCKIEMGSYGYSKSDLQFFWINNYNSSVNNVNFDELILNEFHHPTVVTNSCQKSFVVTGEFTCLRATFTLRRKFGFYLIYTYVPSLLLVSISCLSFNIDYKCAPARVSLGLLCIVSLLTQAVTILQKLPPVSYIKAIDIWLFACLAFVVATLIEFIIVQYLVGKAERTFLKPERLECLCKFLFPLFFLLFNVLYWLYFMNTFNILTNS